jgi:hypothetical protein
MKLSEICENDFWKFLSSDTDENGMMSIKEEHGHLLNTSPGRADNVNAHGFNI